MSEENNNTTNEVSTSTSVQTGQNISKQSYAIPGAIVIAGGFIAVALFFSGGVGSAPAGVAVNKQAAAPVPQPTGSTDAVREVTAEDHIKGNPNAPVIIVEYSDYECPFCKRFHDTMNDVMDKYGESGEVAWVFRQFPLDQLHPKNARKVATAAECVVEQGGNDAFWAFSDGFMAVTPSNDRTDLSTVLPQLYKDIGVDQSQVEACIASGKYDDHIQADFDNAVATGGRGTPWSVVIGSDGKTYPLNGAQPMAAIEQLIKIANVQN